MYINRWLRKWKVNTWQEHSQKRKNVSELSNPWLIPLSPLSSNSVITGVVSGVYSDIPAWPRRDKEDCNEERVYFGIKTAERLVEFECRSRNEKQMWTEGIRHLLNCCTNIKSEATFNYCKTSLWTFEAINKQFYISYFLKIEK